MGSDRRKQLIHLTNLPAHNRNMNQEQSSATSTQGWITPPGHPSIAELFCHHCSQGGHSLGYCPEPDAPGGCFTCGQLDHITEDCADPNRARRKIGEIVLKRGIHGLVDVLRDALDVFPELKRSLEEHVRRLSLEDESSGTLARAGLIGFGCYSPAQLGSSHQLVPVAIPYTFMSSYKLLDPHYCRLCLILLGEVWWNESSLHTTH